MGLAEAPEAGRAEGELPGANEGAVDGDREVDAGVADVGVVEEVVDAGLEGVGVEDPAAVGDLDAELVLFIPFAVERSKCRCCCRLRTARSGPDAVRSGGGW